MIADMAAEGVKQFAKPKHKKRKTRRRNDEPVRIMHIVGVRVRFPPLLSTLHACFAVVTPKVNHQIRGDAHARGVLGEAPPRPPRPPSPTTTTTPSPPPPPPHTHEIEANSGGGMQHAARPENDTGYDRGAPLFFLRFLNLGAQKKKKKKLQTGEKFHGP